MEFPYKKNYNLQNEKANLFHFCCCCCCEKRFVFFHLAFHFIFPQSYVCDGYLKARQKKGQNKKKTYRRLHFPRQVFQNPERFVCKICIHLLYWHWNIPDTIRYGMFVFVDCIQFILFLCGSVLFPFSNSIRLIPKFGCTDFLFS